ncbi:S8 family serine peptidase [Reichenbachiella agarivorans]|uniref:S8 family serine peptidase n=1 Tax=Reichenbachiella agarivorans TaxID=2979464 RepID=A0ABY6CQ81_9BACT|nr:S8 family serine peptidase [Reichenbachiella agarivorans]UXP31949.1 S8 family serine peptidase [Reichenbachiella agarivorans]
MTRINLQNVLFIAVLWCGHHTMLAQPRLIVKLRHDQMFSSPDSSSGLSRVINDRKLTIPSRSKALSTSQPVDDLWVLEFAESQSLDSLLYVYSQSEVFSYVEPDYVGYAAGQQVDIPSDPEFDQQWYLHNDGTFNFGRPKVGADIQALSAWDLSQGDESITVAIIDSGINPKHKEFEGRLWQNNDAPEDGEDNDHNGYIDDYIGWDFVNDDNDPTDDNGHGTAVAGVLAANGNNGFGYAGIDWNCRLMICKVVDANQVGYYSDWVSAIYYAVKEGADVINFSLVGKDDSKALKEAVDYAYSKGVLIVASMGNDNSSIPNYPAAYYHTLAVGSSDPDDQRSTAFNGRAGGSNYGDHIDVLAPGNYILGLNQYSSERPGNIWAGTSMSAPMVAGVVSLLLAADTNMSPSQLTAIMTSSCEDQIGSLQEDIEGWDSYYGWGRINAAHALQSLIDERILLSENEILLYPNPAQREITIKLILPMPSIVSIRLVDTQGRQQLAIENNDQSNKLIKWEIDLSDYPAGIYFIQVRSDFGTRVSRFVKY